jgi:hypothetical protein
LGLRATQTSQSYPPKIVNFIFGRWRKPEIKLPCNPTMKRRRDVSQRSTRSTNEHDHPFGDKPLIDVTTGGDGIPGYAALQTKLLSLSQNSKRLMADKSGHFVIIDRPDVVVDAINQVVSAVRDKAKL